MRRLLLWFFDHLYTDLAWAYDIVAWLASGGLWYEWTFVAERFTTAEPVLEVGMGKGRLLTRLRKQGRQIVGVDRSAAMVRAARQRSGAGGANVPIVHADGRRLPFADEVFGTLITTFPAPYVKEPQTQYEFARVLRPDGRWVWVDAPAARRSTWRLSVFEAVSLVTSLRRPASLPQHEPAVIPLFHLSVERVAVGETSVRIMIMTRTV